MEVTRDNNGKIDQLESLKASRTKIGQYDFVLLFRDPLVKDLLRSDSHKRVKKDQKFT